MSAYEFHQNFQVTGGVLHRVTTSSGLVSPLPRSKRSVMVRRAKQSKNGRSGEGEGIGEHVTVYVMLCMVAGSKRVASAEKSAKGGEAGGGVRV
jgi:hypothetical protein